MDYQNHFYLVAKLTDQYLACYFRVEALNLHYEKFYTLEVCATNQLRND